MDFTRDQAYTIDLSKSEHWKAIFDIPELCEIFKDGRIFGKIAEHILAKEFDNLTLAEEGGPFDLDVSKPDAIAEVKSITKGGFDTTPSYMLGASRTYDYIKHMERIHFIRENNGFYILADNRQLPVVTFYPVAATTDLVFTNTKGNKTGKRTSRQADVFLDRLALEVIDLN